MNAMVGSSVFTLTRATKTASFKECQAFCLKKDRGISHLNVSIAVCPGKLLYLRVWCPGEGGLKTNHVFRRKVPRNRQRHVDS